MIRLPRKPPWGCRLNGRPKLGFLFSPFEMNELASSVTYLSNFPPQALVENQEKREQRSSPIKLACRYGQCKARLPQTRKA